MIRHPVNHPIPMANASVDHRKLLSHRLLVLSNTLGKGALRLYVGRYGVPLAEWRLLAALMTGQASTVNGLAALLATDKGWISRTAAALIRKGLVKAKPDDADARSFHIVVEAKGRMLYERVLPIALERNRKLLAVMSAAEARVLEDLLDRLQEQAERLTEEGEREMAAASHPDRSTASAKAARTAKRRSPPANARGARER